MADAKQIFLEALEFASHQDRANYLEQACAGDTALRGRVDDLLRAHRQAGSFLGGAWPAEADTQASIGEAPGEFVGPYRLLEQIGEGGFGVVFLAEQQQPVRRRVALKVVKPGMDTREVIARFEVERQALAIMDHPNIAQVLDAGATTSGRPYFVMELVRGVAITDYCDQHSLTPYERLELFITVCHAVQHAHQKGIIHRDIKPSNVLVASHDGRPVVKVIDFGVAKAIGGQLGDHTVYTRFTQMIGTPLYMSPEQAELSGLDIDTRTDIYSLGVLLYELLTGVTPFDRQRMNQAALDEIRRIIREEEPPKPSTRLSDSGDSLPSIAASRQTEPARLTKLVRGDLDWIVMKALEKDRRRRYETANGLASDVRRYLLDEPVSAAAPSRVYRIRKFVVRNKLVAAAAAAVIGTLAIGLIGTTIGLIGQSRQRKIADDAREQLEAVNNFLMYDLFAGVEVNRTTNKAVRDEIVKVMIDPAAARVGEQFAGKPLVEAKVRHALAMSYDSVGRRDLALPHARAAHAINLRELGADHPDTLHSAQLLGELLQAQGEYAEAEPLLRDSLIALREQEGDEHDLTVAAINNLASLHLARGEYGPAEELFREAIELGRKVLSEDDEHVLLMTNNLAFLLRERGETDESEALLRDSLERCRRVLKENHRITLQAIASMGAVLRQQGKLAEAEPIWREGMERCRTLLGDDDPETLSAVNDYAGLLMEENKLNEAEPLVRDTLERRRRVLPKDHHDTLVSIANMGIFLRRKRDVPAAEPYCREAVDGFRRAQGDDHPDTIVAIESLISLLMAQDKLSEAEPYLVDACQRAPRVLPDEHPLQATLLYSLGILRFRQGKLAEAETLMLESLERRQRQFGDQHFDTLFVFDALGTVRRDQGRLAEAEQLFRQVQAGYRRAFKDPDHPQIAGAHMDLGIVLTMQKRYPEAEAELVEAERVFSAAPEPNAGPFGHCLESLVALHREWDKAEPGQGHAEKAQTWQAKHDEYFYPVAPTDVNAAK